MVTVGALGSVPVIHPIAQGGPECLAVFEGSIKEAAVIHHRRVQADPAWLGAKRLLVLLGVD